MKLTENFGGTSPDRIQAFERKNNFKLPKDYSNFLLLNNGGYIEKGVFLINDFQGYDKIEVFHGFELNNEYSNLDYLVDMFPDRFIKNIIPVGRDGGGNYICLNVNEGEDYGKIYFYDHEVDNENNDGTLNWDNLYLVADSFTEFIEKLH